MFIILSNLCIGNDYYSENLCLDFSSKLPKGLIPHWLQCHHHHRHHHPSSIISILLGREEQLVRRDGFPACHRVMHNSIVTIVLWQWPQHQQYNRSEPTSTNSTTLWPETRQQYIYIYKSHAAGRIAHLLGCDRHLVLPLHALGSSGQRQIYKSLIL